MGACSCAMTAGQAATRVAQPAAGERQSEEPSDNATRIPDETRHEEPPEDARRMPDEARCAEPPEDATRVPDEEKHKDWIEFKGPSLEPALEVRPDEGHSPIRLVDVRFALRLAGYEKCEDGKWLKRGGSFSTLRRRQELHAEAFVALCTLQKQEQVTYSGALRIIAVSYPWLQPSHPDPRGDSLRRLAHALASFVNSSYMEGDELALFVDFASLHQKSPDGKRSECEQRLFNTALGMLAELYSHSHTYVFKITALPDGYPAGFDFPADCNPNTAEYHDRGWCFCEASVASLVKGHSKSLDLGLIPDHDLQEPQDWREFRDRCVAGRPAPMLPADFAEALQRKTFTSKKADCPQVAAIYEEAFRRRFGEATRLEYIKLGWGDREAKSLASVLARGVAPELEELVLFGNRIGDPGFKELAAAVQSGKVPKLCKFIGSGNPGDTSSLRAAIEEQKAIEETQARSELAQRRAGAA